MTIKRIKHCMTLDLSKAVGIAENALRILPSSPSLHNQLGFLYLEAGMEEVSLFHSKKAMILLGKKNERFEPWMNTGVAYIHIAWPQIAIQCFDKAEKLRDQVNMVEYGKLLIFRAEARRDVIKRRLTNNPAEQISFALQDLNAGEYMLMECDNDTANFWIKQIPGRRKDIESLRDIRLTDVGG